MNEDLKLIFPSVISQIILEYTRELTIQEFRACLLPTSTVIETTHLYFVIEESPFDIFLCMRETFRQYQAGCIFQIVEHSLIRNDISVGNRPDPSSHRVTQLDFDHPFRNANFMFHHRTALLYLATISAYKKKSFPNKLRKHE